MERRSAGGRRRWGACGVALEIHKRNSLGFYGGRTLVKLILQMAETIHLANLGTRPDGLQEVQRGVSALSPRLFGFWLHNASRLAPRFTFFFFRWVLDVLELIPNRPDHGYMVS